MANVSNFDVVQKNHDYDIPMEEIFNRIKFDYGLIPIGFDGNENYEKSERFHLLPINIEKFVRMVIDSRESAFIWDSRTHGKTKMIELTLGYYLKRMRSYLALYDDRYDFSEYVKLFFDCANAVNLDWSNVGDRPEVVIEPTGRRVGEFFNDFIEMIRTESRTREFRKKVSHRGSNSARNFRSIVNYISALFEKYSKLLVLRIDLGYRKECATEISLEEVQQHLTRFLNNWRSNSLFKHCVGYIWKLEQGDERGFHIHMVLFFNGNKVCKDAYITGQVGDYWVQRITAGRGTAFNCNWQKARYKDCGIGMIEHTDQEKRKYLLQAMIYLTKKDQYIKIKTTAKMRVFGRGEMPERRQGGPGRPRRKGIQLYAVI